MTPADLRCSALSASLGEPLGGTAPTAAGWLVLEQPGPWGRQAALDSRLDREVGALLMDLAAEHDGRFALARRPAGTRDQDRTHRAALLPHSRRSFWVASTRPGAAWLAHGRVRDPRALTGLDWTAFAEGNLPALLASGPAMAAAPDPLVLVCTNGRRDQCCALLGRSLVAEVAAELGPELAERVWETSHTGGHRFAPTGVVLPWGLAYGRMDPPLVAHALAEAQGGRIAPDRLRGRTCHDAPAQAAELSVRESIGDWDLGTITAERVAATPAAPGDTSPATAGSPAAQPAGPDPAATPGVGTTVRVAHRDGRSWTVTLTTTALDPPRAESCGGANVRPEHWTVTALQPA